MREKLVKLRKKENLTQREIAEMLDITRAYYGHIENGIRDPNLSLAIDIADLFGENVQDIFLISDDTDCKRIG